MQGVGWSALCLLGSRGAPELGDIQTVVDTVTDKVTHRQTDRHSPTQRPCLTESQLHSSSLLLLLLSRCTCTLPPPHGPMRRLTISARPSSLTSLRGWLSAARNSPSECLLSPTAASRSSSRVLRPTASPIASFTGAPSGSSSLAFFPACVLALAALFAPTVTTTGVFVTAVTGAATRREAEAVTGCAAAAEGGGGCFEAARDWEEAEEEEEEGRWTAAWRSLSKCLKNVECWLAPPV
eukprot:3765585-Rhodomonas_salina.1